MMSQKDLEANDKWPKEQNERQLRRQEAGKARARARAMILWKSRESNERHP